MSNSTLEPIESARTKSQPADGGTSDEAVHALFQKELGLVEVIAKQIYKSLNGLIEMDELMNAGREGLFTAARRFDPAQGVQFRTYANYRVRGAIIDAVRQASWLPRRTLERIEALGAAGEVLEGTVAQVFKDIDSSVEFEAPQDTLFGKISGAVLTAALAAETFGRDDGEIGTAELGASPEDAYAKSELLELVHSALGQMDELEANVIRHYYFEHHDLEATAAALGIRASWVSRVRTRATERLSKMLRNAI